jgi:hypothetical protein
MEAATGEMGAATGVGGMGTTTAALIVARAFFRRGDMTMARVVMFQQ